MIKIKEKFAKPLIALAALATIGAGAGVTGLASAQTVASAATTQTTTQTQNADAQRGLGVMGTVSAVSGNTLTVTDSHDNTTYTVDVSSAKIMKGSTTAGTAPTTIAASDIAVGDTVGVRGTVSGTSVVATDVMDGLMQRGMGGPGGGHQPGVMGTVSAISGNTVTITNQDGTSYTVDASSAKVSKTVDIAVTDIAVGDKVGVEGTVSGTTVTATHIMDGVPAAPTAPTTTTNAQ